MLGTMRYARIEIGFMASWLLLSPGICAAAKKPRVPVVTRARTSKKFSVQVVVAPGANQDSPIPTDFVAVSEKKLIAEIAKLSAKDWFDRRVQLMRDFPDKVQVVSWEWVPAQHAGPISIDLPKDALAGFVFANYANAGDHRAVVDLRIPVVLTLGAEEFSLQQLK